LRFKFLAGCCAAVALTAFTAVTANFSAASSSFFVLAATFWHFCGNLRVKLFGSLDPMYLPTAWYAADEFFLVLLFKPSVTIHVMFQIVMTLVDEGIPRSVPFRLPTDQEQITPLAPWCFLYRKWGDVLDAE
jgi:hypothetical protein